MQRSGECRTSVALFLSLTFTHFAGPNIESAKPVKIRHDHDMGNTDIYSTDPESLFGRVSRKSENEYIPKLDLEIQYHVICSASNYPTAAHYGKGAAPIFSTVAMSLFNSRLRKFSALMDGLCNAVCIMTHGKRSAAIRCTAPQPKIQPKERRSKYIQLRSGAEMRMDAAIGMTDKSCGLEL